MNDFRPKKALFQNLQLEAILHDTYASFIIYHRHNGQERLQGSCVMKRFVFCYHLAFLFSSTIFEWTKFGDTFKWWSKVKTHRFKYPFISFRCPPECSVCTKAYIKKCIQFISCLC